MSFRQTFKDKTFGSFFFENAEYVFSKKLGSGKEGKTYLYTDSKDSTKVLVNKYIHLSSDSKERERQIKHIKNEAEKNKQLHGVGEYFLAEDKHAGFVIMPLQQGDPFLFSNKRLEVLFQECIAVITEAQDFHKVKKMVHRDLFVSNILIHHYPATNQVKANFVDFSCAETVSTTTGPIYNSGNLRAPEVEKKNCEVLPYEDVYVLGVNFNYHYKAYEMQAKNYFKAYPNISWQFKYLIDGFMRKEPLERLSLQSAKFSLAVWYSCCLNGVDHNPASALAHPFNYKLMSFSIRLNLIEMINQSAVLAQHCQSLTNVGFFKTHPTDKNIMSPLDFIKKWAAKLSQISHANEKAKQKPPSGSFACRSKPEGELANLEIYLRHILDRVPINTFQFSEASVLLDRFLSQSKWFLHPLTVHRLIAASLLLTTHIHSSEFFAKAACVKLDNLTQIAFEFRHGLKRDVYIEELPLAEITAGDAKQTKSLTASK